MLVRVGRVGWFGARSSRALISGGLFRLVVFCGRRCSARGESAALRDGVEPVERSD